MKKLLLIILFFCLGCSSPRYIEVPVETVRTEYIYKLDKDSTSKLDSIYVRDSIFIKEKGDTIFQYKEKTKYKIEYKDKIVNKTDTILKIDSIEKPVIIKEEVEINKIYWWQKVLMYSGLAFLIGIIIKLYNKIKGKC